MATTELPQEIQDVLVALDRAADEVASQLQKCADFVNAGVLDQDLVMLKIHALAARLMGTS